jgi:hypothetical protein
MERTTMNIFWACAFVILGKVTVLEVAGTREGCEAIQRRHEGSICFPVNVRNTMDAQQQIEAINAIIK